jgi:hypothetical protein
MTVTAVLLDEDGWVQLQAILDDKQLNPYLTGKLIEQLRALGAQTFLMEDEYVDRDFSDAFAAYYSRLFKRHSKICRRIHFFSQNLDSVLNSPTDAEIAEALQGCQGDYLGFVVLRPVHQAPIASAVLRTPAPPAGHEAHPLVRAKYYVHLLGAELLVEAFPMTQQDQRIGACAQATIWSAARHFHARHSGPWVSMVSVTEAAMIQEVFTASSTLPNGSEFLSLSGMVSALRVSGRKPLIYMADGPHATWQGIRPTDVINRYVDSGIPVIVGLTFPAQNIGHAVIASGQVFSQSAPTAASLPPRPTRASFCSAFYVNDDQRGPNLRMPISAGDGVGETDYSVHDNVKFLIIPLPDKVFLPAEKAELFAWDLLAKYAFSWSSLKASETLGSSEALGDSFTEAVNSNAVVARTYLTYGWKYKHRMLRNRLTDATKSLLNSTELPRYVWVTEFGTLDSFAPASQAERRIFAHCVVDATAKNMGDDSCLFFHAPGLVIRRTHSVTEPYGPYEQSTHAILNDQNYFPKIRGRLDFQFYAA